MRKNIKLKAKQKGATLIESLVALFVFAVGALGIAALQTTTLVRSDDVKQRSIAIWKAQELADRIKATTTVDDPDGLVDDYLAEVNVQNITGIGNFTNTPGYSCPTTAPTRCDDTNGGTAANCSSDQLVAFDVWSVFCDPETGASDRAQDDTIDGLSKLKNLDIALIEDTAGEYRLYLEWWSRSSDQNEQFNQTAVNINTDLCGEEISVDARLNVYCLRFR